MSRWSDEDYLSIRQIARQAEKLILLAAASGWLLPRKFNDIRKALVFKNGHAIVKFLEVLAYAEIKVLKQMFILCSVVVKEGKRGGPFGWQVVSDRIDYAFALDPDKPINLACSVQLINFYRRFGFVEMLKMNVPVELMGNRSMKRWLECDRIWMSMPNKAYWEERRGKTPIK